MAIGQRVRNTQPDGGLAGLGGSPGRRMRLRRLAGSSSGTADSNACVYGCRGALNTCDTGPVSMTRPRYITATRSHRLRTTARSWLMNSERQAEPRAGRPAGQHLRLHRHVQRGDRFIGHQESGAWRARARCRCAVAGHRRIRADSVRQLSGRPTCASSSAIRSRRSAARTISWIARPSPIWAPSCGADRGSSSDPGTRSACAGEAARRCAAPRWPGRCRRS